MAVLILTSSLSKILTKYILLLSHPVLFQNHKRDSPKEKCLFKLEVYAWVIDREKREKRRSSDSGTTHTLLRDGGGSTSYGGILGTGATYLLPVQVPRNATGTTTAQVPAQLARCTVPYAACNRGE